MMTVNELISNPIYNQKILVKGCIVIINHQLWLIDSDQVNNFPNSLKIKINNDDLKSILLVSVALYSGITGLFHDAQIAGYLSNDDLQHELAINITELIIKDGNEWKNIDVNARVENNDLIEKNKDDWHDLFKE